MTPLELAKPSLVVDNEIRLLLAAGAPVAIGVSGGKDSCAVALATIAHLDQIGHTGPRLLIHADLGVTEWQDSLPTCERLAKRTGLELVVVRRPQGDMMQRWEQRWRDNLKRWLELSCVKLILPWSTPDMRFCTSEMKVDQICRGLVKRFPGRTIINVTGIRRQESRDRAKAPISKPQKKLTSKTHDTLGIDWHPIADWSLDDVLGYLREQDFSLHEAYTIYGASRVSCVWCILAKQYDHRAAILDERNHVLGRRMVDLEIVSTFAFQGDRWLGDTLQSIITPQQRHLLIAAKERAIKRQEAEAHIPKHLLYTKGWPTCVPTQDEAKLLGAIRLDVAEAVGVQKTFTDPDEIRERYQALMEKKNGKRKGRTTPSRRGGGVRRQRSAAGSAGSGRARRDSSAVRRRPTSLG